MINTQTVFPVVLYTNLYDIGLTVYASVPCPCCLLRKWKPA